MKTKLREAKLFAAADPAGKSQEDFKLSPLNLCKAPGHNVKEQAVPEVPVVSQRIFWRALRALLLLIGVLSAGSGFAARSPAFYQLLRGEQCPLAQHQKERVAREAVAWWAQDSGGARLWERAGHCSGGKDDL